MQTTVLDEVLAERQRQDVKWGEQNHPDVDHTITRECARMCRYYEIPTEQRAKLLCNRATNAGTLTFAHILIEEVSEAVSAATCSAKALRAELIQVAAVAVSWVEAIDRRAGEMARALDRLEAFANNATLQALHAYLGRRGWPSDNIERGVTVYRSPFQYDEGSRVTIVLPTKAGSTDERRLILRGLEVLEYFGEMIRETRCESQLAAIRAALVEIDDWAELVEMTDHFIHDDCDCHIAQKIALRAARVRFDESATDDWTELANIAATVSQGKPQP